LVDYNEYYRVTLDVVVCVCCLQYWLDAFLEPAQQLAMAASTSSALLQQQKVNSVQPPTAAAAAAAAVGSELEAALPHVVLGKPHYGPFHRAQSTFYAAFMQYGTQESG
jgi:hypothetical protein